MSAAERAARAECVAIGGDTAHVPVDTFDREGRSSQRDLVEVTELGTGRARYLSTSFGEQGRFTQYFAFAGDSLVCAEERTVKGDSTLSGRGGDVIPIAVVYVAHRGVWFNAPPAESSSWVLADSAESIGARLHRDASALRAWVSGQRRARRKGAS